jgi:hypothetical protein
LIGGFYDVLVGSRQFLALRQAVLKKVLRVGAVRSCPYLITKSSQVGVDTVGISYLL